MVLGLHRFLKGRISIFMFFILWIYSTNDDLFYTINDFLFCLILNQHFYHCFVSLRIASLSSSSSDGGVLPRQFRNSARSAVRWCAGDWWRSTGHSFNIRIFAGLWLCQQVPHLLCAVPAVAHCTLCCASSSAGIPLDTQGKEWLKKGVVKITRRTLRRMNSVEYIALRRMHSVEYDSS